MPREHNFLLGKGERLVEKVSIRRGGGEKNPPYDFQTAVHRLSTRVSGTARAIKELPPDACPKDEAVAVVTMHPRYVSKSDFPMELLGSVGLRAVGSRQRRDVKPEAWGVENHPKTAPTEDIFVAGPREAFYSWAAELPRWKSKHTGAEDLGHIETVAPVPAKEKVSAIPDGRSVVLEAVLHNHGNTQVTASFLKFVSSKGAQPDESRMRTVRGLTFLPVRAARDVVEEVAKFAFLRVIRGMPTLRPIPGDAIRSTGGFSVNLPQDDAIASDLEAVVFDGGIPTGVRTSLAPWVSLVEPQGIGPARPQYESHGLAVTGALLFGHLLDGQSPGRPFCRVEHVRVLDQLAGVNSATGDPDFEYYDVLDRILSHLDRNRGRFKLVNISLGPNSAMDDADVSRWTAELDERFSNGESLVTVAVGNSGNLDPATRLNRVQPPSDGVNMLSVGAADSMGTEWSRATYSCVGPGRCPGLVKPDGVAFGGCSSERFGLLSPGLVGVGDSGTSFASPFALRSGASVMAQIGPDLSPLAVRALMIERAEAKGKGAHPEVGWGRFESDPGRLITCEDTEALVVYQGVLPMGEHLRAPVPLPDGSLTGKIQLSATLVISTDVDPEYAGAYTRSGLDVSFRPDARKFSKPQKGKKPQQPKSRPFFSAKQLYSAPEYVLREDGHKWEPCRRGSLLLPASGLFNPMFDVYYHPRESRKPALDPKPISYALVVHLNAKDVSDFYDRVVRTYAKVLVPLRPRIRIQPQARNC